MKLNWKKLALSFAPHFIAAVQKRQMEAAQSAAERAFNVDLDEEPEPEPESPQETRLQTGTILQRNRRKIVAGITFGLATGIALAVFGTVRAQEDVSLNAGLCSEGGLKNCLGQVQRSGKTVWDLTFLKIGVNHLLLADTRSQDQGSFQLDCVGQKLVFISYNKLGDSQLIYKPESTLAKLPRSLQARVAEDVCPLPSDVKGSNETH